jgi:hypothetical protein
MVGATFVGRQGELECLGRVLRGDPGAALAAVVIGDAGIGKTRLLREAVQAAPEVKVLLGACLPLSESLPYGAVTDALAILSSPDSRPALDQALVRCAPFVRRQVAALIPALDVEPRHVAGAAVDRTRLFAALRDLIAALGAERRTALVIEDLHWADAGTLDLLTFLVHGLRPGTALIASSRLDELRSDHPTLIWLAAAARTQEVETVALAPLPPDDTRALVASLVGDQRTSVIVADVLRRGEGSPFFTEQLVAASSDVVPTQEELPGVPPGVAQMLLQRVRSVSADGIEVAAALSVAARPLSESELAVCLGTGTRVPAGLRELLDAHLAEPAHQDRYRLRHALLEDTVRGTLLSSQRATLHSGVAAVLAARDGDAAPAEVAAHWARAGNMVEEARWSVDAARHAERVFAWREASSSWRRVWDLWESLPGDARPSVELSEAVLSCLACAMSADDHDTFMRLVQEALADERVTTDDQVTGRLLLMYGNRLVLKDVPTGLATLERAVELFDRSGMPSAAQATTLIRMVLAKILHNYLPTGTEDAELARATAIAEQLGELGPLIHAESLSSMWRLQAGNTGDGLAELGTILQRARDANVYGSEAWVAACLVDAYRWLMQFTDGIDVGRHSIGRVRDHGVSNIYQFALLVENTVDCLLLTGDVDAAEQLVAPYAFSDATNAGGRCIWRELSSTCWPGTSQTPSLGRSRSTRWATTSTRCTWGWLLWGPQQTCGKEIHGRASSVSSWPGRSCTPRRVPRARAACWLSQLVQLLISPTWTSGSTAVSSPRHSSSAPGRPNASPRTRRGYWARRTERHSTPSSHGSDESIKSMRGEELATPGPGTAFPTKPGMPAGVSPNAC